MTHAQLAARIAERFLPPAQRAEYSEQLARALDDRGRNNCRCNVEPGEARG